MAGMTKLRAGNGLLAAPNHSILLGLGGLLLTTALGFAALVAASWTESTFAVDEAIHGSGSTALDHFSSLFDALDKPVVVAVILLVLGVIITLWRGWLPALGFMFVAGGGWVVIAIVKLLVAEPRPTAFNSTLQEQSLSYPSGHVTFVMALTIALAAVLAGSRWRWPMVVLGGMLVLLTGYTRLYLGVHYPGDIIGGMLGGYAGALLMLGIWNAAVRRFGSSGGRHATS